MNLATLGAGFAAPVLDSQQVFRGALEALSRPGRLVEVMPALPDRPDELHASAAALALALLDQDTALWLSPRLRGAGPYLRFHTGGALEIDAGAADFALLDCRELERLDLFKSGSDEYPDRSATLIVQVASMEEGSGFTFSGPGIRGEARVRIDGFGEKLLMQWARNRALFPRGVDLFFACGTRLCGVPRTTRIDA